MSKKTAQASDQMLKYTLGHFMQQETALAFDTHTL